MFLVKQMSISVLFLCHYFSLSVCNTQLPVMYDNPEQAAQYRTLRLRTGGG